MWFRCAGGCGGVPGAGSRFDRTSLSRAQAFVPSRADEGISV